MAGVDVERMLKDRFWKDSNILGTLISDVRTTKCQNKCSGHGTCNSETRACMCETFWMPDIFFFWGISQANCGEEIVNCFYCTDFYGNISPRLVNFVRCDWGAFGFRVCIGLLLGLDLFVSQNKKASHTCNDNQTAKVFTVRNAGR